MIQIDALSAFNDNYIWLLQDATSRRCAVVDPGDAKPVEAWLAAHPDWRLSDILVTHHHHDHVGGVAALKELTGARVLGPANEKIPARDLALEDGERVEVLGGGGARQRGAAGTLRGSDPAARTGPHHPAVGNLAGIVDQSISSRFGKFC